MSKVVKCKDCRFWDCYVNRVNLGDCRINSPTTDINTELEFNYGVWPMTREDDWCGKAQTKED